MCQAVDSMLRHLQGEGLHQQQLCRGLRGRRSCQPSCSSTCSSLPLGSGSTGDTLYCLPQRPQAMQAYLFNSPCKGSRLSTQ